MFADDDDEEGDLNAYRKYLRKLMDRFLNNLDADDFTMHSFNNPYGFSDEPPFPNPWDFNSAGGFSLDSIDDVKKYLGHMGKNYDVKKMITISIEEGDDEGIKKAIELLKSLLSENNGEAEIIEPTEEEDFDETFKEDWE